MRPCSASSSPCFRTIELKVLPEAGPQQYVLRRRRKLIDEVEDTIGCRRPDALVLT